MNDSDAFDDVPAGAEIADNAWMPERRPGETLEDPLPIPRPRMTALEAFSLLLWTGLADWLIYRTDGFSGPALFIALAPVFFLLCRGQSDGDGESWQQLAHVYGPIVYSWARKCGCRPSVSHKRVGWSDSIAK